ncbi:C-type lectin 37Db-like [Toxorhynchites rutilus septentrionalis]|uniref:C-type lectin 37Db-like n=1 Tax=Toxorhynchites rutilus septentrionalis TaxID=329112 RepID=UPI002478E608|nr:C-type lectin 37Db-like [Toxorhynchites rutilus septentrionalis]XP_055628617.1 C-type lectin 37Db-like [Toxorhynchites rutilus septentrionalis]
MQQTILAILGIFCVFAVAQQIHCTSPVRYVVSEFKANWFRASEYCFYRGMQLAIVKTPEEHRQMVEVSKDSHAFSNDSFIAWFGGNDLAEEGIFIWHATGERVRYANWRPGQPDNYGGDEDCMALMNIPASGWQWHANDGPCQNAHYFICQNINDPFRRGVTTF